VTEADETHLIGVVETATDSDGGPSTTSTSAAVGPVSDITLAFSTAASISGNTQEGQVLAAVNGTLNDNDAAVTGYQWTRDGANISGATGSTYAVTEADETHLIAVVETASDSDGGPSTTSTSAAIGPVSDITLAFASVASISGNAQEGQVLTAVNGTLNDSDAAITGYQWTRDGANISGATGSTYTVTEADETHLIAVVESATDSDGGPSTTSTSAAVGPVSDIALAFATVASISGNAQEGQTLTAVNGTLNDSDAAVTGYQWTSDGVNISGATGSTYTVTEADEGQLIAVVETAGDSDGGPSTISTSAPVGPVSDITLAFASVASISGNAQEGQVLTAVNGTLNDSDAAVTGYQWTRDGVNISGATASTYAVTEADEGHLIAVVETAGDGDGGPSTTSTSTVVGPVSDIAPTLRVTISGKALEGQTLKAVPVANDADAVFAYQWQVFSGGTWANITNATGKTLAVTEHDEGKKLRVIVTSSDTDGSGTSATSAATKVVTDAAPTLTLAQTALTVSAAAPVAMGISVSSPDADDTAVSVSIGGIASYEFITATDGTSSTGSSFAFTAAEVNAGLTLHSTFGGTGHPQNTLTVTATNTEAGVTVSSKAQTITVTDPPVGNASLALLTQFIAGGFAGDLGAPSNTWTQPGQAHPDLALSPPAH
jgi:hypothetical protein